MVLRKHESKKHNAFSVFIIMAMATFVFVYQTRGDDVLKFQKVYHNWRNCLWHRSQIMKRLILGKERLHLRA
jgi:hypothetical protein